MIHIYTISIMTSFSINNSRDIICDKLFLLDTNNVLQSALDLINAGGGPLVVVVVQVE